MLAGKPIISAKWRYPIYCKHCNSSINGGPDWDKSCCNSCANYQEPCASNDSTLSIASAGDKMTMPKSKP